MFFAAWKRSIKDMLNRKEFIFAFTVSVLFIMIPMFIDMFTYYNTDIMFLKPAWFYWGVNGIGYESGGNYYGYMYNVSWAIKIFNFCVLPFIVSLTYSYCYYDDNKNGILKILIPITGRKNYYLSNALTIFLSGFFIAFLPLLLEQLVLFIFCPINTPFMISRLPIADDYISGIGKTSYNLESLRLNYPYLFNLLYCIIPSVTGGLMALLSYSVSLFTRKSRFLILTAPAIMWIVIPFLITNTGMHSINLNFFIQPQDTFFDWIWLTVILMVINTAAICSKLLFLKDEI
jgi:hypothetical protein